MFKKMITLALVGASFAALPGCTDSEIAASALVIGAAVICDDGCGPDVHYHHVHRYPPPRYRHYDRWAGTAASDFVSTDARVIKVANSYDISHYAATYVVRAILLAEAKDTSGIKALGLDVSDFKDIMDGKALESDKLNAMSLRLLMSKGETEDLVQNMSQDIQAEKAARGL